MARWVCSLLLFPLAVASCAEITGRVRVTVALTKKRVSMPQVYERHVALAPAPAESSLGDELRRVVVYIDSAAGLPRAMPVRVTMDQRNRRFEPEVLAIPVGSTVEFPNSDPIFHNVFSLSGVRPFDLGNYAAGGKRSVVFPKAGLVQLHCHLHPNMNAAILVAPSGAFAQPDADGRFELKGLAPGRYALVAWHKSAGLFRRAVTVEPGREPATVDFEIPISRAVVAKLR